MRQIREEIVASGEPLLDWEGIEREKAERRGGEREYAIGTRTFINSDVLIAATRREGAITKRALAILADPNP